MIKSTIFIDMDNTAVNYDKQLEKYKLLYPKYKYPQSIIGFFSTMEQMPGFINSWNILSEYFNLKFLTRPSIFNLNSYMEKAIWVRDNMGGVEALERLNICPDKSIIGGFGDILIDDFDIHGQKEFKGEFIQFGKGKFKDWQSVTKYVLRYTNLSKKEIENKIINIYD